MRYSHGNQSWFNRGWISELMWNYQIIWLIRSSLDLVCWVFGLKSLCYFNIIWTVSNGVLKELWACNVCFIHLSYSQWELAVKFFWLNLILFSIDGPLSVQIYCWNSMGEGEIVFYNDCLIVADPLCYVGFTCVYMLLGTRLRSGMWAMFWFYSPFENRAG